MRPAYGFASRRRPYREVFGCFISRIQEFGV